MRKTGCPVKDSLHGGPLRVSSPPIGHTTAYGKSVMDKYMKAENTQKRYLSADFPVLKSLISQKVNSLEEGRDFIPKIKIFYSQN